MRHLFVIGMSAFAPNERLVRGKPTAFEEIMNRPFKGMSKNIDQSRSNTSEVSREYIIPDSSETVFSGVVLL